MKKVTLKISGLHCSSCVLDIDGKLEDTDGIDEAKTSYAKMQTEILFDEKKVDEKEITDIISSLGYKIKAE